MTQVVTQPFITVILMYHKWYHVLLHNYYYLLQTPAQASHVTTTDVCPPATTVMEQTTVETIVTKTDAVSLSDFVSYIIIEYTLYAAMYSASSPWGMLKAVAGYKGYF